jgi:predicted dehydrogenase
MKTIKTGIIGTGFIGPAHIEALRRIPGVEVVAIADISQEKADEVAKKLCIPKAYGNWKDLVADKEIEVIHDCTPNYLHYDINMAVIKAGKHIISEKPLGMNAKESGKMLEAARKAKIVHAINYAYRGYPLVQEARNMIQTGNLGTVFLMHGSYLQDWLLNKEDYNWRIEPERGGALRAIGDIGSHWCDLIQYISGLEIESVCADLTTFHTSRIRPPAGTIETFSKKKQKGEEVPVKTEDAGSVLLQFKNGARGMFLVSQVSAGRKNRLWLEIDGSSRSVAWNQEEPNNLWIGEGKTFSTILPKDPGLLNTKAAAFAHYPGGHPEGYPDIIKNLFQNVYKDILNGTRDGNYATFADGHRADRVNAAILKSHQTRRWVKVEGGTR